MSLFRNLSKRIVEKSREAASKVSNGREYVASATNSVNSLFKGKTPHDFFEMGDVIQIVSRSSERTIQIVVEPTTQRLICDAIGGSGPEHMNAQWTVVRNSPGRVSFHNFNNYLSMIDGKPVIIPLLPHQRIPAEAEFLVQDVLGSKHGFYLQSVIDPGYVLSFDSFGNPLQHVQLQYDNRMSQFEIKIIRKALDSTANSQPIPNTNDDGLPSYAAAVAAEKQ